MLGIRTKLNNQSQQTISSPATPSNSASPSPKKPRLETLAVAPIKEKLFQDADNFSPVKTLIQPRTQSLDSTNSGSQPEHNPDDALNIQLSSTSSQNQSSEINTALKNTKFEQALMAFSQSPDLLVNWLKEYSESINDEIIRVETSNKTAGPLTKLNLGNPIYYASVLGMDEALPLLIEAGCDPNYRHPSGDTALLHCAEQGYDDCMKVFLEHAQNIDFAAHTTESRQFNLGQSITIDQEGELNVLGAAIKNLRDDIVDLLLSQPFSQELLTQKDQFGRNAKQQVTDLLKLSDKDSPRYKVLEQILASINENQIDQNNDALSSDSIEDIKLQEKKRIQQIREKSAQVERQNRTDVVDKGLAAIEKNYNPLHPEVYNIRESLAAIDNTSLTLTEIDKPDQTVYSFPLAVPELCKKIMEEITHYEKQAITHSELELPLHTRHDGNLGELENCGFLPLLEDILSASMPVINRQIAQEKQLSEGDWSDHIEVSHAFLTRNHPTAEKTFKIHQDKSDYTLNLCLHASNDLEGSTVGFYQERPSSEKLNHTQPEDNDRVFTYQHQLGTAAFHSGKVWHRTDAITQGSRASLILWLKAKD